METNTTMMADETIRALERSVGDDPLEIARLGRETARRGTKARGEFTAEEVERLRQTERYARENLERLDEDLELRRAIQAAGVAERRAAELRRALDDPAFLAALRELDRSVRDQDAARVAERRCGSRRGWGRRTPLADQRAREAADAEREVGRRHAAYRIEALRLGLEEPISPGSGSREYGMRNEAARLDESRQTIGALRATADALAAWQDAAERLELAEARVLAPAKAARFARALGTRLDLLVRLASGYSPRPETVRGDPTYPSLAAVGMLSVSDHGHVSVTMLGRAVAREADGVLPGARISRAAGVLPTISEVRAELSDEEVEALRRPVEAALALDASRRPASVLAEVPGASYRLASSTPALRYFLRVIGADTRDEAPERKTALPPWTPGEFVEAS